MTPLEVSRRRSLVARSKERHARRRAIQKLPDAQAARYSAELRRWLAPVIARALDDLSDPPDSSHSDRYDGAFIDWVRRKIGGLRVFIGSREEAPPVEVIRKTADGVVKHTTKENKRILGVEPALVSPETLDGFRRENLDLITALPSEFVDDLEVVFEEADAAGGLRVEEIRKTILERGDVTRAHADLIARDQVLKLNGQITEEQHAAAGVTEYVWSTSKDSRVRDGHARLEGSRQRWDSPPVVSEAHVQKNGAVVPERREHPGGDYQCRCVAIPVLPSFLDDL